MYITKLDADDDRFRTIKFKPNRINIILGKKTTNKKGKSVNGVGKSLSLKLIDFCLGSTVSKDSDESELLKLKDWEFFLYINIDGQEKRIKRSINDKNKIYFNNIEFRDKQFNQYMENILFDVLIDSNQITYRNLISRFLRIPKRGYIDWNICKKKENDDSALMCNSFLMGLDVELVLNKIQNKQKINKLQGNKKIIENDETIRELIKGTEIGVNIDSLERDIKSLEFKIRNFQISEEYNLIKESLEKSKYQKQEIINEIVMNKKILENIEESIKIKIDITAERVLKLYEDVKVVFEESIVKSLKEVSNFHVKLIENRQDRLKKDRKKILHTIGELNKELSIINNKINTEMDYLKDKASLDEYDALRAKLTDMKLRLQKMREHERIVNGINTEINSIKLKMASEDIEASEYVEKKPLRDISNKFKEFIDYIYEEERVSGVFLENNTGSNKLRFNIKPEITSEKSAGINNVKIFCMDMINLYNKINHRVEFIYHDSTLFSEIDPRQVYKMFKLAEKICTDKHVQYIANLNYDMYEKVLEFAKLNDDLEFVDYIQQGVVKELCDDNLENKLLGIEI
ncbi:DUF2326 domain-containing protein [Hathewaya massiliensis]|uniref:DUF2326 domain-containing protein n=1 Tax=Hathewaya massiliensis TaxID=1964382 RepID=UPI001157BB6F|nr:DUF2326 domain-containing protein [Hathewaya massiliensis]